MTYMELARGLGQGPWRLRPRGVVPLRSFVRWPAPTPPPACGALIFICPSSLYSCPYRFLYRFLYVFLCLSIGFYLFSYGFHMRCLSGRLRARLSPRGLGRPMVHMAWEELPEPGALRETLPQQLLVLFCGAEAQLHMARIRLEASCKFFILVREMRVFLL